jgi:hypothetical protein
MSTEYLACGIKKIKHAPKILSSKYLACRIKKKSSTFQNIAFRIRVPCLQNKNNAQQIALLMYLEVVQQELQLLEQA